MRIGLAQINPLIGDFRGNVEKIRRFADSARGEGCDLVVFPELALLGYPPRDLLDIPSFVQSSRAYWSRIQEASRGIGLICGVVAENESGVGKPYHNTALFFDDGRLVGQVHKRLLPSYDVFDEERYFEPGQAAWWTEWRGTRIGITICEDIWNVPDYLPRPLYRADPMAEMGRASVQVLVNISASPFHLGKASWVGDLLGSHSRRSSMQMVYVNQVGGNDELVFQGRSMVWDDSGRLAARGADFAEDLVVYDTETRQGDLHGGELDPIDELLGALVLGLRDYATKCGFDKAVVGLSGGIDSAVVACVAALALGAEQVLGIGMPGPYNAPESLEDAAALARRISIPFAVVPITELFEGSLRVLAPAFENLPVDVTEENMQARLRGLVLMAFSNKFNRLLLSTGNKSEMAVGYCTLYGDMNGGLAVLGDVPKTMVYQLAHRLNERHGWIPDRTLTRPPSAELRPDQKDQDSLPPYDVLDAILTAYVEKRLPATGIVAQGWDAKLVRWVIERVDRNEYKRWQAPPILRVTSKAFGIGRRLPIAQGFKDLGGCPAESG
jgi:NAD+ synthase (glutamine-hydrolysing)